MVNRRPHILMFNLKTAVEAYQDENGDWVNPAAQSIAREYKCRAEPNGAGDVIPGEDGVSITYSWIIYLDKNVPPILYGQSVNIFQDEVLIGKGSVKMFHKGQMNSRLWV